MDSIAAAIDYLLEDPDIQQWNTLVDLVQHIKNHPTSHWKIPEEACLSVGGERPSALAAVAAIIALHTSIIMVDDLLDGDKRFENMGLASADVSNLALSLQAAGINAISRSKTNSEIKHLIIMQLNHMMISTSSGQHADTHTIIENETDYWLITRKKSSPFFACAFYCGALIGGAAPETSAGLLEIGSIFGEMIQIHDDLKDTLSAPASPDWQKNHISLPILFAVNVKHPEQNRFLDLRTRVFQETSALKEAQGILIHCGAVSYCAHQLLKRYNLAHERIEKLKLPNPEPINRLLDQVIEPVLHIFKLVGISTLDVK